MASSKSNLEALANRLYREEWAALVRWVAWRVSPHVAEDAVSFAFGQLGFGLMAEDHPEPVGWLRLTAYREALRLIGKDAQHISLDDVGDVTASPENDPAAALDVAMKRGLLDAIKPDQRAALVLFAEGYSYKAIAEKLGWTYTKVNRSITEGRQALRSLLGGGEN